MDITPYVDSLRRDLLAAAEAAGPEAREVTERLSYALDPAARLALMEAVAQAAAEITAEMADGTVDVRLNGRQLDFVVDAAAGMPQPPNASAPAAAPGSAVDEGDAEDATARITLRLPESVKLRAEELAARSGHSLNTWLVGVVRSAIRENAINVDIDLSSIPFLGGSGAGSGFGGGRNAASSTGRNQRRHTGWV